MRAKPYVTGNTQVCVKQLTFAYEQPHKTKAPSPSRLRRATSPEGRGRGTLKTMRNPRHSRIVSLTRKPSREFHGTVAVDWIVRRFKICATPFC